MLKTINLPAKAETTKSALYAGSKLWIAAIGLSFVLLAGATAVTKRPWVDEGWFVSPAVDLATRGSFGTLQLDPAGSDVRVFKPDAVLSGINQHTYWVMPLHLLELAFWGKLFGFSVFSIRIPSLLWGLVNLISIAVIVRRLYPTHRVAALLAAGVLAADFGFVDSAADGRMDMMCSALGFAGLAAYLAMREQNFHRAVAASHFLAAAACLTHPNGIFASITLVVTMLWFDRKRIRPATVAFMAAPYALGFGIWAAYCLKAPGDFAAQFSANSAGRARDILTPWKALIREVKDRYAYHYFPAWTLVGKIRGIGLVLAVAAGAFLAGKRTLRQMTSCRLLLCLVVLRFVMLALGATGKYAYYLVHITPLFAALIAVATVHIWSLEGPQMRRIAATALSCYFGIQIGSVLADALRFSYQRDYLSVVSYLRSNTRAEDTITGSAELAFGLGFYNPQLRDDAWLGYWSGRQPSIVVFDRWHYTSVAEAAEARGMPVANYIASMLNTQFRLVKEISGYRIYRRHEIGSLP